MIKQVEVDQRMKGQFGTTIGWLRRSQSGQAIVIVAFMILILLTGVGLAIDGGVGYVRQTAAEKAAAAAALSGVVFMPYRFNPCCGGDDAWDRARLEASRNGFTHDGVNTIVTPAQVPGSSNQLKVTIRQRVGTFFMQMFGVPNYWVQQVALASLLPPLQIGQPGGQLGSAASELGSAGHYYVLRTEGWKTDRGQGDAYTPTPAGCGAACNGPGGASSDVHRISQVKGKDYGASGPMPAGWWPLPDRGGYNFRIFVPAMKTARVEVYNAGFGIDNGSHCDNWQPDGAGNLAGAPKCNTAASNYHMHENDGTFNPADPSQYQVMMYTLFQMNNEYIRTTDTFLEQDQVKPVDARPRWAGAQWTGTPHYHDPVNSVDITQTFDGSGAPTNMQTYHWWIDVLNYNEPDNMNECNKGSGPTACSYAALAGGAFGQAYRLRMDNMSSTGGIPSGSCCAGGGHKGTAIRVIDTSTGGLCTSCSLGALGDLAFYTPFQNGANASFTIPIFQLPPDYRGRLIQLFVFDPGDIGAVGGGELDLGVTDPTVAGACNPDCLASLTSWDSQNLGCARTTGDCTGPGMGVTDGCPGCTSPVQTFGANAANHPYDNYWLLFDLPINTDYNPDPLDSSKWWWGLQYYTTNTVTATDTITITLEANGSPAHLCVPNPPQC